ncbi:MAG TPA: O-antigen ligase family protein [Solirubrobacteraceae bacterium]|nr:O-antigen ligase family protein [Solirubrobacteraceae bacterium]
MPRPVLWRDGDRAQSAAVVGSALASLVVAAALQVSLAAALALVVLLAAGTFVVRFGAMGLALFLTGALPWLVVFGAVEPKLAETFTAGTLVVVLLVVAAPRHDGTRGSARLRLGMILFYVPVVVGLARAPGSAQFIEAAKYFVFPFTVLVVTEGTNHPALKQLSKVVFVSGLIAVAFNLMVGAAGLGHSYYAAGDIQGFAGEHDFALLAGAVTAASIAMGPGLKWTAATAMGAVATIATGVRSALPGLMLVVLARLLGVRARMRTILALAAVAGVVLASGVGDVVVRRFTADQALGQYSSFANLGSGRGEIYTTALHAWWVSSPVNWVLGTGLRSVEGIEQQATGNAVVAQSDVVQVGVETGLIGLLGLALIWWTLIARARSKLPLLVLLPFALFNGSLEYGAPVVVTLLLTIGPGGGSDEAVAEGTPPGRARPVEG